MNTTSSPEFTIHPLALRFDGDLEAAFLDDYFQKSLSQVRFGAGMGVFFSAIFGLLDYLLIPDVLEQIWFFRYAIICPLWLLFFIITWTPHVKRIIQPYLVTVILLSGFGIIAMTVIAYPPGSYYYYAGLLLVLMWAYTFITARFLYASFAGWTLLLVYEFVAIFINYTPLPVLISNSFFFVSANIIGMLACYQIELYKRRDYWQHSLLVAEQAKSSQLLKSMNDELALASDIQTSLLPPASISWPGGEVACFCKPTFEIGGDFYSYHFTKQDHFALAVGDASGHGVSAALIMAATLSLFDSSFKLNLNPCERLSLLDQELISYCEDRHQNCSFCYLELDSNSIYIANAGGIPPLIRKNNGEVHWEKVCGVPLGHGLGSELGYVGVQIPVTDGDFVVLFSDGAVEAKDNQQKMLGFKRLEQLVAESPADSAQAMLDYVVREVLDFTDENLPQDDFTVAVFRIISSFERL